MFELCMKKQKCMKIEEWKKPSQTHALSPTFRFIHQTITLGTFTEVNCCFLVAGSRSCSFMKLLFIQMEPTHSHRKKAKRKYKLMVSFPIGVVNLYSHILTVNKLLQKDDGKKLDRPHLLMGGPAIVSTHTHTKQSVVSMLCIV